MLGYKWIQENMLNGLGLKHTHTHTHTTSSYIHTLLYCKQYKKERQPHHPCRRGGGRTLNTLEWRHLKVSLLKDGCFYRSFALKGTGIRGRRRTASIMMDILKVLRLSGTSKDLQPSIKTQWHTLNKAKERRGETKHIFTYYNCKDSLPGKSRHDS